VRVHLASGRGALVEHYLSSKHLRSCSLRAAVTQRPGMRAQGGGSWPKVGPSTGAPTPQALGAPAALSSAPGVPPAVVSVTASAGADATQVGSGGSGPGGSSAGDRAAPGPAPAGNVEAGVAAFALKQSFFLRDLSITDVNEQRWWRWHAEDCVECTMCNKRIFGGGQYRSSLAARVREHRGTAEHSQQYQSLEVALELAQEAAATVTVVLLVALTAVWLARSLECWTGVVSPLLLAVVLLRTTRRPCLSGLCWVLRHLGLVAAMGFRWTALQPCCWTPLIFHVLISLRLASSPSLTPLWSWLVRVSQILLEQPQALHLAVPVDLAL